MSPFRELAISSLLNWYHFRQKRELNLGTNNHRCKRYELEWVSSYDDALEVIKYDRHDVIVVDYSLGERNGLELLREVARNRYEAPIIVPSLAG